MSLCLPRTAGAEGSTCAEVKIEIAQELTLERQAFEAHMRIHNGLSHITLENISVVVNFLDEEGNPVEASSNPDSTTATFFIRLDSTENVGNLQIDPNNLDFTGMVSPSSSADMYWLIIPAPGASDGNPQGKLYYVGATLTYTIGGEEHVTEVTPDYIFVKPMPELHLDYFLPNEVYGDDAWTPETEAPVPFSLGVRVSNQGFGTAWNLKIDSAQPNIVDNEQGLLVDFLITGSEVNGQPATESLLVDFGHIAPDTAGVARWIMTCSLSGQFVEFSADFSHADELGGQLTSLIEEVNTHFLKHDVLVDLPGRDGIRDFLATDDPDAEPVEYMLYESENTESPVTDHSDVSNLTGSGTTYTLTVPVTPGFLYVHMPISETLGTGGQVSALRSDGKQITPENVWISQSRKSNPEDGWDYFVNLFDAKTTNTYTIVFEGTAAQPPVLEFIANQTGRETQPLTFLVEASDPDGTIPILSAATLPVGATLTDHGDGTGTFDWTPISGQAGTYAITVEASDGELTDSQPVTITVTPDVGYMITASAGTGGTISPSGVSLVNAGADQSFTITADTGDHLVDVLVDDISVGAVSPYTFTNVSANHTIAVLFAPDTFTITTTAGAHGSIIPSGAVTVAYGTDQQFTITPDTGYHIIDVRVDGESVDYEGFSDEHNFVIGGTVTFLNVDADHALEADVAIKTYPILATAGEGGSILPSGEIPVDHGSDQSFTITPDAGYHIADVLVDGTSVGAVSSYTFTNVTGPHTIQALFASGTNTHTITATAGAHGSILPTGTVTVEDGTDQRFTLTAESGYHIEDVLVDGVSVGAVSTYTFSNVTDDHTIEATFAPDITTFTITATAGSNGSIDPSGDVTVEHGAEQSFTITPDAGYHITDVLVDGASVGAVSAYTFTNVTADHTIEASFAINTYTITATTDTNGSITPVGDVTVDHGAEQGFTITPDAGYHIADVLVDGTSVGAVSSYTFSSVTADHTIEASFAINTYTIAATAGTNGSITPVGDVTVEHGAEQSFTITADAGYHIADVLVDGTSVGAVSAYTFTNVTADHTIEASFAINTYTITATAGTNGSITPSGEVTVEHGADQSFTITPDPGYDLDDVLVDGATVGAESPYTFTNVTANHTIEAVIAQDTTPPVPTVSDLPTLNGVCSVTVTDVPTALDNTAGTILGTTTDPLVYDSQGTYTITWSYDDDYGNVSTQPQTVIVDDPIAPQFSQSPSDLTVEATDSVATPVTIAIPEATDNCPGTVSVSSDAPVGFPVGATLVTFTATDQAGNTATTSMTVTVVDTTAPVLTVPADITTEATAVLTPVEIGEATATDIFAVTISNDAPADYAVGTTTVTWTATDANGNVSTAVQTMTIVDTTPPVLTVPADMTVEATAIQTPVEIGEATATDIFVVTISNDAPADYAVGTTTVTWTATDANGNVSTAVQTMTVVDTTAPVLRIPADMTVEATAIQTPVDIGEATATDIFVVTISNDAPAEYPIGATAVTWTATDANGNVSTAVQTMTIVDTTAPVLSMPADITTEATAVLTPVDIGTATATDIFAVTMSNDAPADYPIGATTVTWTATDANGNVSTAVQTVTIVDTTAPVLSIPADMTVEATAIQTPVDIGTATATDIFVMTISNDAPANYPVGSTTVTWTATDANGNVSTAIQTITVVDTTAPVLTVPADMTVEATAIQTPVEIGTAAATDIFAVTISNDAPAEYPIGATAVTWTATDANGNMSTAVQTMTVVDTTAPVLSIPADITTEATALMTPVDIGTATATDIFAVTISNDAPAKYPVGSTTVTWTATDANGNVSTAVQTMTVVDTTPPVLTVPADMTVEATAIQTPVDIGEATATDIFVVTISNDAPAKYSIGATAVTWTATDANGNVSTAVQTMTVVDTTAPVLSIPADMTVEATAIQTPVEIGEATATDIFAVTITNDAPAEYPIGATAVTWTATDANGNMSTAVQTMTIVDTTAPVLSIPADITTEATAIQTPVDIGEATATDIFVVTISNDAPADYPIGATAVTWTATDANGNVSTAVQTMTVVDTTPPVLRVPDDISTIATGEFTPVTLGAATAEDLVDGSVPVTHDAPAAYPIGTTVVTYTATDRHGNTATATTSVTIVDPNPPGILISGVSDGADYTDSVTPTIALHDAESGVATQRITLDGHPYVSGTAITASGQHTLLATASDFAGNATTVTVHFSIYASTHVTITATACEYSDPTEMTATLTSGGNPVSGKSITFQINGTVVGTAVTDAAGNALLTHVITLAEGTYPVSAAFAQDDVEFLRASHAATTLAVSAEQAAIVYTGDSLAQYPNSLTLQAQVTDEADGRAGDLSHCRVAFTLHKVLGDGTEEEVGTFVADGDASGTATVTRSIALGVYTVLAEIVADGYYVPVSATVIVPVYLPSGGSAAGGGWIQVTNPKEGTVGRANFGFIARYTGDQATGHVTFQDKDGHIHVKSQQIDWLVIRSVNAQFQGVGTIKGWDGLYTFRVNCTDHEGKQKPDKFTMKIWAGTDTEAAPIYTALNQDLGGGNITVTCEDVTQLTVRKRGDGSGTVLVNGQECGPACQELSIPLTESTVVALEALPEEGSSFVRWEDEQGNPLEGVVYEDTDVTISAVFEMTN